MIIMHSKDRPTQAITSPLTPNHTLRSKMRSTLPILLLLAAVSSAQTTTTTTTFSTFIASTSTTGIPSTGATLAAVARKCEPIQVPMCKGLITYNTTLLPNRFGHTSQAQIYWALQPWWSFMDAGCSDNLRNFLCGMYLPRCLAGHSEPQYPCQETCKKAKVRCQRVMRQQGVEWSPDFKCISLQPKSLKTCIRPERERKKKQNKEFVLCQVNRLPMCQGIPFSQGSLPNMFLQVDQSEIEAEMRQFQSLIDKGCSRKLRLFMCGVFMPFCVPGASVDDSQEQVTNRQPNVPFVVPCRELCQEVYDQCSRDYHQVSHGLPWPAKFHCHRFPSYAERFLNNSSKKSPGQLLRAAGGTSVPCTMAPNNYDGD